jgi:hypothetical protein
MTNSEKAKRYDALQAAIKHADNNYRRRKVDAHNRINLNTEGGYDVISAYNKGLVDAYREIINQLIDWEDET